MLICRLLAKASETAQAGTQFDRTLEQLDASVDRHPTERVDPDEENEEYEDEPNDPEPDIKDDDTNQAVEAPRDDPPKTDRQRGLEAEWGLYRSPQLSQNVDEEDEDETDDEDGRRRETLKSIEDDYMVTQPDLRWKWTDDSLMNRMIVMRVLVIGRIRMSSGYYQLGAKM
jgi:hypothetical protein